MFAKIKSQVSERIRTQFTKSEYVFKYNKIVTDENWGPSASEMDEIVAMYPQGYYDLLPEMQLQLDNRDQNWIKCYKTLLVIDHLARNVAPTYIDDLRAFVPTLREINNSFKHVDEKDVDRGVSVRERAKKVADLLNSPEHLEEERQRAAKTKQAVQGIGSTNSSNAKYSGFGSTPAAAAANTDTSSSWRLGSVFGAAAGSSSAATGASGNDFRMAETDAAAKKRREQEEADHRLAQALQEEEDARGRVEARRRARAAGSGSAGATDEFGELQAVEAAAAASRPSGGSSVPPAANVNHAHEDDFGAFVATRAPPPPQQQSGSAAPSAAQPAAQAGLDIFASPAPAASPPAAAAAKPAPASIDDLFGGPSPQQQQQQQRQAAGTQQQQRPVDPLDIFAGVPSGSAGNQQRTGPQRAW